MIPIIVLKVYDFRCHSNGKEKDQIMNGLEVESSVVMLIKIKMTLNLYKTLKIILYKFKFIKLIIFITKFPPKSVFSISLVGTAIYSYFQAIDLDPSLTSSPQHSYPISKIWVRLILSFTSPSTLLLFRLSTC